MCREKDELEEQIRSRAEEENLIKEKEVVTLKSTCFTVNKRCKYSDFSTYCEDWR